MSMTVISKLVSAIFGSAEVLLLKFIPQQSPMEYVKTFYACFYLLLNSGGTMYAAIWMRLSIANVRFGADSAPPNLTYWQIDASRIVHTWRPLSFNTKYKHAWKALDVFHAGIA